MSNNHELQDQDLQLTAANQVVELDDNELDSISGGVFGAGLKTAIALSGGKRGWDVVDAAAGGAMDGVGLGLGVVGVAAATGPVGWGFGAAAVGVGASLSTPEA